MAIVLLIIVVEKVTNLYNLFHARVHEAKRAQPKVRRTRNGESSWEGPTKSPRPGHEVRGRTRSFFSALILRLSRRFSAAIGRYYLPDEPASPLAPLSPGSPFGPGRPRTPLANVTPLSPLKPYNDTARSDPTRSSMCAVNFFFCFYDEALIWSSFKEEGEEEGMVPRDLRRSILVLHID